MTTKRKSVIAFNQDSKFTSRDPTAWLNVPTLTSNNKEQLNSSCGMLQAPKLLTSLNDLSQVESIISEVDKKVRATQYKSEAEGMFNKSYSINK